MYKIIIAILVTATWATAAEKPAKAEPWQSDFQQFLTSMEQSNDRASTDLEGLKKAFLGKTIKWKGTLKYVCKGKPYIRETFVRIDQETQMSRVMYYTDPDDAKVWEEIAEGSAVEYSGTISDVKVMAGPKKSFLYVELSHVKIVASVAANPASRAIGTKAAPQPER